MDLLIKLSSMVCRAFVEKKNSLEFFSQTYQFVNRTEMNLFCTIYRSTIEQFSSLKSDLTLNYRAITLTKPDYHHIFLVHLIQSGFHYASQLSKRFLNYLSYLVDQSLFENVSLDGKIILFQKYILFFSLSCKGLQQLKIDLNPLLIQMLIKLSRIYLKDDFSRLIEDEETALYKGLSIINKSLTKNFNVLTFQQENSTNYQSFPLTNLSTSRHLNESIWNISDAFELALNYFHFNINEMILKKLFQLNLLYENHRKIFVLGRSEYGKSSLIKLFVKAQSYINHRQHIYHHLMLRLWTNEQLISRFDSERNLFQPGLLTKIIEQNRADCQLYLHFDGFDRDHLNSIEDFILNVNDLHLFWEVIDVFS